MTNLDTSYKAFTHVVTDPVCGMAVIPGQKKLVTVYNGKSYWFCARTCRQAFEENPNKYLGTVKRKGWFGRFLERMSKANEEQFGGAGPKCH